MLYRVYIDDSADQKREIIMAAGALIAKDKDWGELSRKWRQRLKRDGLQYFKAVEYRGLRDQFSVFTDAVRYPKPKGREAAKALHDDLEGIIKQFPIIALAVIIPLPEYKETVLEFGVAGKMNPDPFSAAMQSVMRNCVLLANEHGAANKVAFVCDDSSDSVKLSTAYAGFKEKNILIQDALAGLVHLDDKTHPPLQAADMVASLGREMGMEYLNTGGHVELPRLQGVFHKLEVWDREWMRTLASLQ
jgi:hypothetical protein